MSSPLVSVIVVNWNGKEYLRDCFQSLCAQTFSDFEVILVDNGSTDGSVEYVQGNLPGWAKVLTNIRNEGFSGGNNRGIREASGKYIVLLNNDAQADACWLEERVKLTGEDPRVGMSAAKIYPQEEEKIIDNVHHLMYQDGLLRFLLRGYAALIGGGMRESLVKSIVSHLEVLQTLLRAYLSSVKGLPKMWKKRKEIKRSTRVSDGEVRSWFGRFGMSVREISWKD